MRKFLLVLAIGVSGPAGANSAPPAAGSVQLGSWGIDLTDQDRSVRPGDDFFRYQNGGWVARAAPDVQHPFMSYWRDVRSTVPPRLIEILNRAAAAPSTGTETPLGKAATLYREYLDEATIERRGHAPLEPELAAIRAIRSRAEMSEQMGRLEGPQALRVATFGDRFGPGMFTMTIAQDRHRTGRNALYLGQGGIMLPDPSYYSRENLADIKTAYEHYVERLLTLIGWPEPAVRAREIVDFETRVAQASTPLENLLDPARTYNSVSIDRLQAMTPGFDWSAFFRGAGLTPPASAIVDDPAAFTRIAAIYTDADMTMLRARQAFVTADLNAGMLGHDLYDAKRAFRTNMLNIPSLAARERHDGGERLVEGVMPDTLGSIYVERFFSPTVMARAQQIVRNLRTALDARLQRVAWLNPASRTIARRKLAAMQIRVGYQSHFEDYHDLHFVGDGLYEDVHRAAAYEWREQVRHLSEPFDRSPWALAPMYPQYGYFPQANTANVSAALLQPPFFDPNADDAVNYGAVGTIIAQQIMAGFGPNNISYDGDGRLTNWLTPTEAAHLAAMATTLAGRYSAFEPISGAHPRGQVLVGEAMADIGAIEIALDAYHASLHGRPAPVLDNLTGDQRFFLGRAQSWRARFTDDAIRNQLAQGTNAVPWMRVNGPLPNVDSWYAAFNVQPGERLYVAPSERVHPY